MRVKSVLAQGLLCLWLVCVISSSPACASSQPAREQGHETPATQSATASSASAAAQPFSVKVVGKGEPMILIPGLLSSGDVWTTTVDRYKDRYECHVLTLAGFAGQPAIDPPFLDTVREGVIHYVHDHHLARPVIVGHSLGAFLAFWIASTAPDAVGSVVAVDGVPFLSALMDPAATPDSVRAHAAQMRDLYATFTPQQLRGQSQMTLASMIKSPADVERALGWAEASTPKAVGESMYEMMVTDLRDQMGKVTAPVLLLAAADFAKDAATREMVRRNYEAQVAKVPTHTVTLVPEARHFIMFDAPAALWSAMDAFLAAPPRASASASAAR
jgi:pimeloyl-ACP methyl ester carboxylesterase